ncbi:hypothetical protein GHT06_012267 [Daphnia sinensis]|uniref:Uncharacterized protein n=1 Tax=Daphnia sinensis TaxID=1820382 RepID=A0AAD5LEL1_9CRUS|nr:hypothetical protein GHT06_012267 [Daphnia sinensis]
MATPTESIRLLPAAESEGIIICRVRTQDQCVVQSDILALKTSAALLLQQGFKAIIISGGPNSAYPADAPRLKQALLAVFYGDWREKMFAKIGNSKSKQKWRAHYLKDLRLGTKGICIAKSSRRIISVIADTERYLYGVQFHGLTENGRKMLHNCLFDTDGLQRGFTVEKREQQCIDYMRCTVGQNKIVVLLVCGGVYSAVRFHMDDGSLREDEPEQLRVHDRVVEAPKDFHKDEVRASGCELGLPAELLERHSFPGPDASADSFHRLMVDYGNMEAKEHALLNQVEIATSEEERLLLEKLSSRNQYVATLLRIRTVGVQGNDRCNRIYAKVFFYSQSFNGQRRWLMAKITTPSSFLRSRATSATISFNSTTVSLSNLNVNGLKTPIDTFSGKQL